MSPASRAAPRCNAATATTRAIEHGRTKLQFVGPRFLCYLGKDSAYRDLCSRMVGSHCPRRLDELRPKAGDEQALWGEGEEMDAPILQLLLLFLRSRRGGGRGARWMRHHHLIHVVVAGVTARGRRPYRLRRR